MGINTTKINIIQNATGTVWRSRLRTLLVLVGLELEPLEQPEPVAPGPVGTGLGVLARVPLLLGWLAVTLGSPLVPRSRPLSRPVFRGTYMG